MIYDVSNLQKVLFRALSSIMYILRLNCDYYPDASLKSVGDIGYESQDRKREEAVLCSYYAYYDIKACKHIT
jgi:hypothetical protein